MKFDELIPGDSNCKSLGLNGSIHGLNLWKNLKEFGAFFLTIGQEPQPIIIYFFFFNMIDIIIIIIIIIFLTLNQFIIKLIKYC